MKRRFGSVTELVLTFGDCLRALAPHVSKVGIKWEEGKSYDDWDEIAEALYSTVVAGTIAYTVEGEGFDKLAPYAMEMPDYSEKSFLFDARLGRNAPFIKLQNSQMPFDTALFIELDHKGRPTGSTAKIPLDQAQFLALLRSSNEQREIVNAIIEED